MVEYFEENLLSMSFLFIKMRRIDRNKKSSILAQKDSQKREEVGKYYDLVQEVQQNDREYLFRYIFFV